MSSKSKSIVNLLTSPSKVAQALDWRKATGTANNATVIITKNWINILVSSHPEFQQQQQQQQHMCVALPSIPIQTERSQWDPKRTHFSSQIVQEVAGIVQDWKITSLVVFWPLQTEGGRHRAASGQVLYALDQLFLKANKNSNNTAQPFSSSSHNKKLPSICLWSTTTEPSPCQDPWGRDPLYARTACTNKTIHIASKEQYEQPPVDAAHVWNDFVRAHWPDLYQHNNNDDDVNIQHPHNPQQHYEVDEEDDCEQCLSSMA